MIAICVDDEKLLMEEVVYMVEKLPQIDKAYGFTSASDAMAWMSENGAELAILDIDMPGKNGIELAMELKGMQPDIAIIFLTGYAEFAVEVITSHIDASGYLLKPVSSDKIAAEVEYALAGMGESERGRIMVRTFGEFELMVDGRPVAFERSKSKELLAYLVDRQGAGVTRKRVFSVLWEDGGAYDRPAQKYLDVVIRSLRNTLSENGAEDILEMEKGMLRVCPENFECDVYRFFEGDTAVINSYRGEYMSEYSWASMVEAYMDRMKSNSQ